MISFIAAFWMFLLAEFAVMAGVILTMRGGDWARGIKRPVKDKMLRPAGESLRQKMRGLEEHLGFAVIISLVLPLLLAMSLLIPIQLPPVPLHRFFVGLTGAVVFCLLLVVFWVRRVARRLSNYSLGFSGERAVGESLAEVLRRGCRVFHDFPADPLWNIDHIVVAPAGVYAIETKTRRKRSKRDGHTVIFDGRMLHFPNWSDRFGVEQAERNAKWLAEFLSRKTGDRVRVQAVLTLPGWMVRRKTRGSVMVVNPKELRALICPRRKPVLSEADKQRLRRISEALDEKCRDVEF